MPTRLVTAPTEEPVTLFEAKAHLRLEHELDDASVEAMVSAARIHLESICWRGFVTQTWELVAEEFPSDGKLELPCGNLASITSAKYIDQAGVEQTLSPAEYVADSTVEPGLLRLAYGKSWPSAREQWDAVKVRYVVGWAAASVPPPIRHAIMLLVAQMYDQRTPEITGSIVSQLGFSIDALIGPYRLARW